MGHGPRPVIAVPLEGPKGTQKVLGSMAAWPRLTRLQASAGPRDRGKVPGRKGYRVSSRTDSGRLSRGQLFLWVVTSPVVSLLGELQ